METLPPSPVQLYFTKSDNSPCNSPGRGNKSTIERENVNTTRTGLVSTQNGHRRSYGTLERQLSSSCRAQPSNPSKGQLRQHTFMIQHPLEGSDTLQGLALKYGVSVSIGLLYALNLTVIGMVYFLWIVPSLLLVDIHYFDYVLGSYLDIE